MLPFHKLKVKVVFLAESAQPQTPTTPMNIFRCGRFRLIVHQASPCEQYMLDEDQVAVYVIMGEIRPVVEPDHDPVGGCSSGVSLFDLKSQNIPLPPPAPVRAVFHFQRSSYIRSTGCIIGEN